MKHVRYNNLTPVTVCILIALFAALPASMHADIIPGNPVNEEFELDLGPQGKGLNRDLYGYGTLSNRENIEAGEWGTWELVYHVGRLGVDDGGRIFLLFNAVADWGRFQFDDPRTAGYVSVRTDGNALVSAHRNSRHAGPRPFWGGIIITVREGNLVKGNKVFITLGDRTGGSPGIRAPTIVSHLAHEYRFMVDPLNAVNPVRVKDSPRTQIIGGETVRLEALWPSEVTPGKRAWLLVKAKDHWGNPAKSYTGTVRINAEGFRNLPATYRFTENDAGYHRFEDIIIPETGAHVINISDIEDDRLSAQTNVMVVKNEGNLRPYCGDLHGQHIRGSSNLHQYASYARGFAGIDFMSWAVNDFHLPGATWHAIQETSREFNEPGRFVVFPGYEWSGTTGRGGDHNVVYLEEDRPLFRSAYVEEDLRGYDQKTDRYTVDSLTGSLSPGNVFLMPHIGGRRANLDFYDAEMMPFIEIYSDHGQFEWFLEEALTRGLKVGFTASSDDVYGKLGDSIPGVRLFAVHGGITCVYAEDLNRTALWQAFMARRVYGTTGERMQLRFNAGDHWLGEEINQTKPPVFTVETGGTAGIERVEIFRGPEVAYTYRPKAGKNNERIKVIWRGAASRERARQTTWRGTIKVEGDTIKKSSPYRLDYPTELLIQESIDEIRFDTFTAGDEDGVILDLDVTDNGTLLFESEINSRSQFDNVGEGTNTIKLEIPLNEISDRDLAYPAGGLDREIIVRRVKSDYPRRVTFTWTEDVLQEQTTAYWVRVLQEDGATAWSSPIFVTPEATGPLRK
ncbi:MAG: DUF3604 domain-containing protein [Gammaproteobacteria bacterium]|nr:DUF3604 domain-containing protein [Gammaproteobacteria bacterium]